ncbi:MAG: hypothetical protein HY557_07285 [Euryarchaeota archaeon]|nr:hypothetical protein [Euryarchaeota archaeon]
MRIVSVEWSRHGAPPEAVVEAFAEAALLLAVLDALLDDPEARERVRAIWRGSGPTR